MELTSLNKIYKLSFYEKTSITESLLTQFRGGLEYLGEVGWSTWERGVGVPGRRVTSEADSRAYVQACCTSTSSLISGAASNTGRIAFQEDKSKAFQAVEKHTIRKYNLAHRSGREEH